MHIVKLECRDHMFRYHPHRTRRNLGVIAFDGICSQREQETRARVSTTAVNFRMLSSKLQQTPLLTEYPATAPTSVLFNREISPRSQVRGEDMAQVELDLSWTEDFRQQATVKYLQKAASQQLRELLEIRKQAESSTEFRQFPSVLMARISLLERQLDVSDALIQLKLDELEAAKHTHQEGGLMIKPLIAFQGWTSNRGKGCWPSPDSSICDKSQAVSDGGASLPAVWLATCTSDPSSRSCDNSTLKGSACNTTSSVDGVYDDGYQILRQKLSRIRSCCKSALTCATGRLLAFFTREQGSQRSPSMQS
eukprot:6177386-Pleurochrysis_carterae.AAC.2